MWAGEENVYVAGVGFAHVRLLLSMKLLSGIAKERGTKATGPAHGTKVSKYGFAFALNRTALKWTNFRTQHVKKPNPFCGQSQHCGFVAC